MKSKKNNQTGHVETHKTTSSDDLRTDSPLSEKDEIKAAEQRMAERAKKGKK